MKAAGHKGTHVRGREIFGSLSPSEALNHTYRRFRAGLLTS